MTRKPTTKPRSKSPTAGKRATAPAADGRTKTIKAEAGQDDAGARKAGADVPHVGHPLEWLVAALGAVLVLSTILYLLWVALFSADRPAALSVIDRGAVPVPMGHGVAFDIVNDGDTTAADIVVRGTLSSGDAVVEESEVVVDLVPQHAQRTGTMVFEQDPDELTLELSVRGFLEP
jgi:uncharacterized protein (TIGR02588 family)